MNYTIFMSEIRNLNEYRKSAEELQEKIVVLNYRLEGVKGISYDKQKGNADPHQMERYRLDLIDRINEIEKEIDLTQMTIQNIERKINLLPEEYIEICHQISEGKSYEEIGREKGFTASGIWVRLKKEVEKI